MKNIPVSFSGNNYEIYITNNFDSIDNCLDKCQINEKILIVSDEQVGDLYEEELIKKLKSKSIYTYKMGVGENYKNLNTVQDIYDKCFQNGFNRASSIIALGGGVVGDTAGYAAATYMRGIRFIQIPTTIISDVDSSTGGKVGVNYKDIKNLVGTFYHPQLIYINVLTLKTLDKRHIISGISEVIKYAVLYDRDFFNYLNENVDGLLELNNEILNNVIEKCIMFKIDSVKNDVYDKGERQLLNFGHSIGHVIESVSNYSVYHGEAVAVGMMFECALSNVLGVLNYEDMMRIFSLIGKYNLNKSFHFNDLSSMFEIMSHDKKADRGIVKFIIPKEIGKASLVSDISESSVIEALKILKSYWISCER